MYALAFTVSYTKSECPNKCVCQDTNMEGQGIPSFVPDTVSNVTINEDLEKPLNFSGSGWTNVTNLFLKLCVADNNAQFASRTLKENEFLLFSRLEYLRIQCECILKTESFLSLDLITPES